MSRMADFYLRVCDEAGLDMDEPATMDRVATAFERAEHALEPGATVADLFDATVDLLILGSPA